MNTFLNELKQENNYTLTENGAVTHKELNSEVYELFASGGSYRRRTDEDCILLFKNALEENESLALKCLFYLRDCRQGQGERRFFRVCYQWLCKEHLEIAKRNLGCISEYGRWDDLIYTVIDTPLEDFAFGIIKEQLQKDLAAATPSLLGQWMPSENTSSENTRKVANKIRKFLKLSHKQYRQILSQLRKRINVLERHLSANQWDKIQFDKIPSKAGMKYKRAFATREETRERYQAFMADKTTKVHASVLYPYDIAKQSFSKYELTENEVNAIQKYWDNLPNYYGESQENGLAIVDVSGSMYPNAIFGALGLGGYVAEKAHGPFAHHFITFSKEPELVKFEGLNIVDKFNRAMSMNWGSNTNIEAVFDMLLQTALSKEVKSEDIPTRLYIFSDMEFDEGLGLAEAEAETLLEGIAKKWAAAGYELPQVIFWNLDSRQQNYPAQGKRFSYISGLSPILVEQVLSGKTGVDVMLDKLLSKRYEIIK